MCQAAADAVSASASDFSGDGSSYPYDNPLEQKTATSSRTGCLIRVDPGNPLPPNADADGRVQWWGPTDPTSVISDEAAGAMQGDTPQCMPNYKGSGGSYSCTHRLFCTKASLFV